MTGRILIVSGPPGAGKSTISRRLADEAPGALAVHLHTDDFYTYVRKGFVRPWTPQAQAQNITIMNALAVSAAAFAQGGYEVLVDGIVGPWFFDPWLAAAREGRTDLRYICLLPDEATTLARGTARSGAGAMTDPAVIGEMWAQFRRFPSPTANLVDSTGQELGETVALIQAGLAKGRFTLS
jgi:predicted kinase